MADTAITAYPTKTCKKCNNSYTLDKFTNQKRYKDGKHPWCKSCRYVYDRLWSINNKLAKRTSILKSRSKKFGLTYEEYQNLINVQNNQCAICKKTEKEEKRALAIDHCHSSGKIRGLLCHMCNRMLGMARDNIDILNKAISYLEKNNGR